MNITYNGSRLNINGISVETPCPIRDAFAVGEGVIVLMDQFADLQAPVLDIREVRNAYRGRNLICYSPNGTLLWKAEFPEGNDTEDYYYRISSRVPLVVNSFSSYRCEIDPLTGRIIHKDFVK